MNFKHLYAVVNIKGENMLLAVDIGNTNITMGIVDKEMLIKTLRQQTNVGLSQEQYETTFKELLADFEITECIIGSVVNDLDTKIKKVVDKIFGIDSLTLSQNINIGIKIDAPHPEQAGADRIANICGANKLYPKPYIVVDMGTATTFDIADKNGAFIGGTIMLGVGLQLKSLSGNTSLLPDIEPQEAKKAIGDDTVSSILSGVIRGHASAIDGLIEQCEAEFGEKLFIIRTGGYSELVSKYMKRKFDAINPNLTLEGLKEIYKLNR